MNNKSRKDKKILDACCGGRMFWFNKNHPNALYIDNRVTQKGDGPKYNPGHEVKPDMVMDFKDMKFKDNSFHLVVFDPPHGFFGKNSFMSKQYGSLDKTTWKSDISRGFDECWRVLKTNGVLIFKWNQADIKLKEILSVITQKPLFGHTTGSNSKTHWLCFMKL